MYKFKHLRTGQIYSYKTLRAAMRAKDRLDREYGAVVTSYPTFTGD